MAGPIAHIFSVLTVLNSNAIEANNRTKMIIGTSFPDIRYLKVIERTETHEKNITWDDVVNAQSDFEKGRLLHCLLDVALEQFVEKNNLQKALGHCPFHSQILKFYADIVVYKMVENWHEICPAFDTIASEEIAFNISQNDILYWHKLLKKYCKKQPDVDQILLLLKQYIAFLVKKENNFFKRLLLQCKGVVLYHIVYFKLGTIIHTLEKNHALTDSLIFFYTHLEEFLKRYKANNEKLSKQCKSHP